VHLWLSPHDARIRALQAGGELHFGFSQSSFGRCVILMAGENVLGLHFTRSEEEGIGFLSATWSVLKLIHSDEAGRLIPRIFEDPASVPLIAIGTPFQLTVWEFLRSIPKGTTLTYGEVARAIGRPKAARAVGRAVGANNIAVLIPCHRVVSRGKLTGYRWGLDRKKALLAWELSTRDPLEMPF
jgi:AraC family transcriptional regulator of adaptative response/methylated-DNA-[protein]-cysteine methyltransferase